jgi:hypothetical protein
VLSGTCSYDATTESMATFSPTDGPYTIEFEDGGGRTEGSFAFVGAGDFYPGQETTVVSPAIDLTYVGPDASYERTILVNETS